MSKYTMETVYSSIENYILLNGELENGEYMITVNDWKLAKIITGNHTLSNSLKDKIKQLVTAKKIAIRNIHPEGRGTAYDIILKLNNEIIQTDDIVSDAFDNMSQVVKKLVHKIKTLEDDKRRMEFSKQCDQQRIDQLRCENLNLRNRLYSRE